MLLSILAQQNVVIYRKDITCTFTVVTLRVKVNIIKISCKRTKRESLKSKLNG